MYHVYVWCQRRVLDPLKPELKIRLEAAYSCWETNPGLLEEQKVLLKAGISLEPPSVFSFILIQCFCVLVCLTFETGFHTTQAGPELI